MTTGTENKWLERIEADIAAIKISMGELVTKANAVGEQGRNIDRAFEEMKTMRAEAEKQDERYTARQEAMTGRIVLLEQAAIESRWVTRGAVGLVGLVMTGLVSAILILVLRQPLPLPDRYVAPVPVPPPTLEQLERGQK